MYQFFKGLKANYLISAILCILFGLTLIIWPDISSKVVCIGLGCVLAGIISRVSKTAKAVKQTMETLDVEAEFVSGDKK